MRDYVELAESLRLCAKYGNAENALANAETAADAIEELLAAVPQWISVEERLPDKHGRYLCRVQNIVRRSEYYTQVLNFEYGHFSNTVYFGGDAANENVSHWMPLPKPPKEVE